MAVKTTHDDYKSHIAFIADHSVYHADTGLRTMTKADRGKLAETFDGVTPAVAEAVHDSDAKLVGAAIHVATDDLLPRIKAAREAGDDTSGLKNTFRISTQGGSTEVDVRATRTRQNPRTGEPVTKHGVVDVNIDANKRIPGDASDRSRTLVTAALGLAEIAKDPVKETAAA
jgi:hypothetical protein